DGAIARVVDVGRHRQRLVGGTERAHDEARLVGVLRGRRVGASARELGGREIDLARHVGDAVVAQAYGIGVESVGRQDIGAGVDVGFADLAHDVGTSQVQKVVVALLVA